MGKISNETLNDLKKSAEDMNEITNMLCERSNNLNVLATDVNTYTSDYNTLIDEKGLKKNLTNEKQESLGEKNIAEVLLTIIGIIMFIIAVAYFIGYVKDKDLDGAIGTLLAYFILWLLIIRNILKLVLHLGTFVGKATVGRAINSARSSNEIETFKNRHELDKEVINDEIENINNETKKIKNVFEKAARNNPLKLKNIEQFVNSYGIYTYFDEEIVETRKEALTRLANLREESKIAKKENDNTYNTDYELDLLITNTDEYISKLNITLKRDGLKTLNLLWNDMNLIFNKYNS